MYKATRSHGKGVLNLKGNKSVIRSQCLCGKMCSSIHTAAPKLRRDRPYKQLLMSSCGFSAELKLSAQLFSHPTIVGVGYKTYIRSKQSRLRVLHSVRATMYFLHVYLTPCCWMLLAEAADQSVKAVPYQNLFLWLNSG